VDSVDATSPKANYAGCVAVVVPTPELEFGSDEARRLADYVQNGGNALLLLGPTLGDTPRVRGTGLEPVLELAGVTLGETWCSSRMTPRVCRAARASCSSPSCARTQSRAASCTKTTSCRRACSWYRRARSAPAMRRSVVMESSSLQLRCKDLRGLNDAGRADAIAEGVRAQSLRRWPRRASYRPDPGMESAHGPRLFVTGASNLAWNRNFQDPSLYGNRRLIENAISWAAARPSMLSVPEKPSTKSVCRSARSHSARSCVTCSSTCRPRQG
jgi:hypothetical protein